MYKYFSQFSYGRYQGPDASLETSLYEYGIIWKEQKGNIHFVYVISGFDETDDKNKTFDHITLCNDLDFWSSYDWIDKESFLDTLGTELAEFNKMPLTQKIYYALNYYGYENIFGTCYYEHKIGKRV